MNKREAAIVTAYTGIICGDFVEAHRYIEEVMKRPVMTHELADLEIWAEVKEAAKRDFINMCKDISDE